MIVPGLTSVTFRNLSPQEVVQLAKDAGLEAIEWGGDVHVRPGQIQQAELVSRITLEAGLKIGAYGSYYRVGNNRDNGIQFQEVLQTVKALGAPIIRIWAGEVGSKDATADDWKKIIEETKLLAFMAGQADICLAFEFHENTINDTYESCSRLLSEIDHPCVKTYWQPIHGAGPEINCSGIDQILPWIMGVHVFHWWPNHEVRLPLKDGLNDWESYFLRLAKIQDMICANLEFIKDDSVDQFFKDAATLLYLTGVKQYSAENTIPNDN